MNKITKPLGKIVCSLIFLFGVVILYCSGVGCVWKYFFDIECPGCGMTRAYIALLDMDFKAAFSFHPMFWSVPVIGMYILCDGKVFRNSKLNYLILVVIGAGFLINYSLKIFG